MAQVFMCDGCNSAVEIPEVVGHVIKRDYCVECAKKAKDFLEAEEVLRAACRDSFVAARKTLINTAGEKFKLPDVP